MPCQNLFGCAMKIRGGRQGGRLSLRRYRADRTAELVPGAIHLEVGTPGRERMGTRHTRRGAGVVSPGSVAVPIIALGPLLLTASAITAPERFLALAPQVEAVQLAEPRVPGRNFTGQRGRWRCSRKCCHHSRRCGGGHDRQAVQIRPAFFVTLAVPKNRMRLGRHCARGGSHCAARARHS